MLRELLQVTNLNDALSQQIKQSACNRGLFIFLEDKDYLEQELTDEFYSQHTSFISKKSIPNPLLEDKIKELSIYGYAISGNKQIFSVQGLNSIYSQLFTVSNIKNFLSNSKEVAKTNKFFNEGFTQMYIEEQLKKAYVLSGGDKAAIKERQQQLKSGILDTYQETIDKMEYQALRTLDAVTRNKVIIEKIIAKFSEEYPTESKTIRLNIVVSDNQSLETLRDESYLYFYHSLLAHKGFYHKGEAYFYSAISSNYNKDKTMMYLNRSDAHNIGNEVVMEFELHNHISLYLFLRSLAQSSNNPVKTFYIKNNKITQKPSIGSLRYTVLDEKKTYYITECAVLNEWNKEGSRPFNLTFDQYISKDKSRRLTISSYDELASIIFFGSKEKSLPNQLFIDRSNTDNGILRNKYYEGNDLSPESKKLYRIIQDIGVFKKGINAFYPVVTQLRRDVFLSSQYEEGTINDSIRNYRNSVYFWDKLIGKEKYLAEEVIYISEITTDDEYLYTLVKLTLYLFHTVNIASKKHDIFTAKDINHLVKTTRYDLLLNRLKQYKKQYQYIFDENNKEEIDKKKMKMEEKYLENREENPYIKRIISPEIDDYLSLSLKFLEKYVPITRVIPNQETTIYALIDQTKIKIKR